MSSHKKSNVGFEEQILELKRLLHGGAANNNTSNSTPTPDMASSRPQLCKSVQFLLNFGFPAGMLAQASRNALANGTTAAEELIFHRGTSEKKYFELLAQHLDGQFVEAHEINEVRLNRRETAAAVLPNNAVWGRIGNSPPRIIIAPSPRMVAQLQKNAFFSATGEGIAITSPSILRSVITKELEPELTEHAIDYLASLDPQSSARTGANAWQGAFFATLIILIFIVGWLKPTASAIALHLVVSTFFISCVTLRLMAAGTIEAKNYAPIKVTPNHIKPTYSVMIALLDEADVVPDLVKAMQKLQWPRTKLEIKLVCEADDHSTLAALQAQDLDARFEIIKVPKSHPRTKPKALCYALGFTTGKYVTIYDAEDRPHPEQLLEACDALEAGSKKIACVQAPLQAANGQHNIWTALFLFEYAALFRGLLPWLARNEYPILLGGTSNHFSRAALLEIGVWDPHNVTEDADLGLRIWRNGYQTDMITRPTLEDAPKDFKTWLPQRTRWFKGWMQTWIVQMRRPRELRANMSWQAFIVTQILLTGTIISALVYPLVFTKAVLLTIWIFLNASDNLWITMFAVMDWTTIFLSYCAFAYLSWKSTDPPTQRRLGAKLLLTPFYWMAISAAAWRALLQLQSNPFYWEKTAHAPHEK